MNLAGAWLLHRDAEASLNVRAAYLEVLSDALSSLAALVAAGVVLATGWTGADPLAGVLIALLIVPRTWSLLKQAVNVLLEGDAAAPGPRRDRGRHVRGARRAARPRPARVDAHLRPRGDERARGGRRRARSDRLLEALHAVLHARFGIDHTTIQLETEPPVVVQIKAPGA